MVDLYLKEISFLAQMYDTINLQFAYRYLQYIDMQILLYLLYQIMGVSVVFIGGIDIKHTSLSLLKKIFHLLIKD
jgi:hypothetical protein